MALDKKNMMAMLNSPEGMRATCLVSMTQEAKARYAAFAKKHGMSMSSLTRVAIEKFIKEGEEI